MNQQGIIISFILCVLFTLSSAQHQWGQPGHDAAKTFHAMHSPSINTTSDFIFVNKSILQYDVGSAIEVIIDGNNVAYLLVSDTVLLAVQVRTGAVLWQFEIQDPLMFGSDPVLGGFGRLYVTYDNCTTSCLTFIVALDTDTGNVIWTISGYFTQNNLVYNPNSGQLLFLSTDQPCANPRECTVRLSAVVDKGTTYEIAWWFNISKITVDADPQLPLVGRGGDIFMMTVYNDTHCTVFQLDGTAGTLKWITYPMWSEDIWNPAGVTSENNYLVYTVYQDVTFVIDGSNGNIINTLNGQVVAVFYSDVIITEQSNSYVSRITASSSTPIWNISIPYSSNVGGASIAGNDTIYMATYNLSATMLSTINIKTGELGWDVSWAHPETGQYVQVYTPVITKDQTVLLINNVSLYQVGCSLPGCACPKNYFGSDCSVQCTSDVTCNGRGTCDSTGSCVCGSSSLENYSGVDCSGSKYNGAFGVLLAAIFTIIFGVVVGGIVYYRRRIHNYERIPLGDR